MIIKLNEESWERGVIEAIQEEIKENYTFYCKDELCIDLEDIFNLLIDLREEYDSKKEKIEDLESEIQNIREYSKPIDPYMFYGVSEEDFH